MLLVSRGTITHNPEAKLKPLPDTYLVQYLNQLPLSHREIPVNLSYWPHHHKPRVGTMGFMQNTQVAQRIKDLDNTCAIQAVARVAPKASVL